MALNTKRLKIFREVAERGSISAAAKTLYITGPGVSHQLAALEREVGVPLLERAPNSISLTEAGLYLFQHAHEILAHCEEALAGVRSFSDEVGGSVRVATSEAQSRMLLQAVVDLRASHPGLRVCLASIPTTAAIPGLRTGEFDVVLSYDWIDLPLVTGSDTTRHDLMDEPYDVVFPSNHRLAGETGPVALEDLADEQWCLCSEENSAVAMLQAMSAAGFHPDIVYQPQFPRSIACGAQVGIGIGIVPRSADLHGLDVVIRPLAEPALTRRLCVLVRSGSSESPAVRAMLDAMQRATASAMSSHQLLSPDGCTPT